MNYIIFDRKSADPAKAQNNKSKQDGPYGVPMWPGAQRPSALPLHQALGCSLSQEWKKTQPRVVYVTSTFIHTAVREATPTPHPLGQVSWSHLLSLTTLYKASWETWPHAQCDSISTAKEGKRNSGQLSISVLVILCVRRKIKPVKKPPPSISWPSLETCHDGIREDCEGEA